VYSGGLVRVKRHVHVGGDVRAGSWVRLGHGSAFAGNIDAVEDVTVASGASVFGTVTHPSSSNLYNHGMVGGEVLGTPLAPILPGLPDATAFSAGGGSLFVHRGHSTVGLTPGSYDVLRIGTGNVLELTAGDYYFNSFTLRSGKVHFDVSDGAIHVFVQGDVRIGHGRDARVIGGEPGQVWFETHGNFNKPGGTWVGGVFAPFGTISFGNGSNPTYIETPGLWAREIDIEHRVTIRHNPVPEPDSSVLFGAGLLLLVGATLRSARHDRSFLRTS